MEENVFEISVTINDIALDPRDFVDCTTYEEVIDAVETICEEVYGCDTDSISNIDIPKEFWDVWEEIHEPNTVIED